MARKVGLMSGKAFVAIALLLLVSMVSAIEIAATASVSADPAISKSFDVNAYLKKAAEKVLANSKALAEKAATQAGYTPEELKALEKKVEAGALPTQAAVESQKAEEEKALAKKQGQTQTQTPIQTPTESAKRVASSSREWRYNAGQAAVAVQNSDSNAASATMCLIYPPKSGVAAGEGRDYAAICGVDLGGGSYKPTQCPLSVSYSWGSDVGSITEYGVSPKGFGTAHFVAQTTPAAGSITADFGAFSCSAIIYAQAGPASSCSLAPESAIVLANGSQLFAAACADSYGNAVDCPLFEWGTDATDATVNPVYSNDSTLFTAGSGVQLDRRVWADHDSMSAHGFRCEASVTIAPQLDQAVTCTLAPANADVVASGTLGYAASCYNIKGNPAACPALGWATDVTEGWMEPFGGQATLHAGSAIEDGKTVLAAFRGGGIKFKCVASVDVVYPDARDCVLSPSAASVAPGGSQIFTAACHDAAGLDTDCPVLGWITDVTGGSMAPIWANDSSTLTAGQTIEDGKGVYASYAVDHISNGTIRHEQVFKCAADVNVTPAVPDAFACALSPSSANVSVNGSQPFTAACYSKRGVAVQCPALDWTTDVTGGFMLPTPSNDTSTLYAGQVAEDGRLVYAESPAGAPIAFICNASVNIVTQPQPRPYACTLAPSAAEVSVGGSEYFEATCYSKRGVVLDCPTLNWTTTVTGGFMLPAQSQTGSTLYAGTTMETDRLVAASTVDFSCYASVNVTKPQAFAVSCSLDPNAASIIVGGSQYFAATCFDSSGNATDCPIIDFFTDVTDGFVLPPASQNGTTLYVGMVAENDRVLVADAGNFSCSASVNVIPVGGAQSCALDPNATSVHVGGTQYFSAACFDFAGSAAACPDLNWTTTVTGGTMLPAQSPIGSTLHAGATMEDGRTVTAEAQAFSCTAFVNVTKPITGPVACNLTPSSAAIAVGSLQFFYATCFDSAGNETNCSVMDWATTITGGSMSPLQSAFGSVFSTGPTPDYGVVIADSGNYSCAATVNVTAPAGAQSCSLNPDAASVPISGTQYFAASCLDYYGGAIACPQLNWTTTVTNGSMTPLVSATGSTLQAGTVMEDGKTVTAFDAAFSCNASVNVTKPQAYAVSCNLTPSSASIQVGASLQFNAACFDSAGNATDCAAMNWTTTVTNGSMAPLQSNDSSVLTAGLVVENDRAVIADSENYSCAATVNVTALPQQPAASCSLLPATANVMVYGTQLYSAACLDANGTATACPTLNWTTTVTDGWMSPNQSDDNSTLTAGNVTGNYTVSATEAGAAFNCTANATVYAAPGVPASCTLSPSTITVLLDGEQNVTAACFDSLGSPVACPMLNWTTNVTNGTMTPANSTFLSALHAGNTAESGKFVLADAGAFNCSASARVVNATEPVSCTLSPASATLDYNSQQSFTAACASFNGTAADCPMLSWSTTVTGSSVSPASSQYSTVLYSGSVTGTGYVNADNGGNFSCSAYATVSHSDSGGGGGEDSHDVFLGYYGGGTSGTRSPTPTPTLSASPTPSLTPTPYARPSPTPTTAAQTPTPAAQATPSPAPSPGAQTGLFTAGLAQVTGISLLFLLFAAALYAGYRYLGWRL